MDMQGSVTLADGVHEIEGIAWNEWMLSAYSRRGTGWKRLRTAPASAIMSRIDRRGGLPPGTCPDQRADGRHQRASSCGVTASGFGDRVLGWLAADLGPVSLIVP